MQNAQVWTANIAQAMDFLTAPNGGNARGSRSWRG